MGHRIPKVLKKYAKGGEPMISITGESQRASRL